MNKEKLLPCPFCGCKDIKSHGLNCGDYWVYYVQCCNCYIKGQQFTVNPEENLKKHNEAEKNAKIYWNTRKS